MAAATWPVLQEPMDKEPGMPNLSKQASKLLEPAPSQQSHPHHAGTMSHEATSMVPRLMLGTDLFVAERVLQQLDPFGILSLTSVHA